MTKISTVQEFFAKFPDDDVCLAHLMQVRFGETLACPKCGETSKFSRIKKIPAYQCQWCGHHVHPMAGTPFAASRTPLQKWFYAMYLFTTSRHGVAAKELQRQLGITYKTAWRMAHEIRKYMGKVDGDGKLKGEVEVDETFMGGRKQHGRPLKDKTIVFGMVERRGEVITRIVEDRKEESLLPEILGRVNLGSTINTDDYKTYERIPMEYNHKTVNHSLKEYVRGNVHTNTIEGFWSRVKNSIKGTHIHVSKKHLQKYLVEFEYRYNMRAKPDLMFSRLLASF